MSDNSAAYHDLQLSSRILLSSVRKNLWLQKAVPTSSNTLRVFNGRHESQLFCRAGKQNLKWTDAFRGQGEPIKVLGESFYSFGIYKMDFSDYYDGMQRWQRDPRVFLATDIQDIYFTEKCWGRKFTPNLLHHIYVYFNIVHFAFMAQPTIFFFKTGKLNRMTNFFDRDLSWLHI